MKCDCCRRKKKLFESFAEVRDGKTILHLCVDCNDLFYKLRDAAAEGDKSDFDNIRADLEKKMKKSSTALKDWAASFIDKQEAKRNDLPGEEGAGKN